jgi:hypothetical protein
MDDVPVTASPHPAGATSFAPTALLHGPVHSQVRA